MNKETVHRSVMLREVIQALDPVRGGVYLDCTLGGGGHSSALLAVHPELKIVGFDRDINAVKRLQEKFRDESRIKIIHAPFSQIGEYLKGESFEGILADLGVSTDQLTEKRGFSLFDDAPLDMRMDSSLPVSADDVVNTFPQNDLRKILATGGVKEASKFASVIVKNRPVKSCRALSDLIYKSTRERKESGVHPATTVFQALRIFVNDEYGEIERLLDSLPSISKDGTRVAVICFHSGEDKIVAKKFREWSEGDTTPAWWRGKRSEPREVLGELVTKKALRPSEAEVKENPASRSARLRVFCFRGGLNG